MLKIVLKIDGMMCGMCESHMNDLIRKLYNVKKVTSSASKGETIMYIKEEPDMSRLEAEAECIGYKVLSVSKEEVEDKLSGIGKLFGKLKKH